jgi:AcrR family transcriptional regulator
MGRPRGFDEEEVVRAAVALFARRSYDGTSVDDLVTHLGVHRGSLYKTFGSKRGLYLRALRRHIDHDVAALAETIAEGGSAEEVRRCSWRWSSGRRSTPRSLPRPAARSGCSTTRPKRSRSPTRRSAYCCEAALPPLPSGG